MRRTSLQGTVMSSWLDINVGRSSGRACAHPTSNASDLHECATIASCAGMHFGTGHLGGVRMGCVLYSDSRKTLLVWFKFTKKTDKRTNTDEYKATLDDKAGPNNQVRTDAGGLRIRVGDTGTPQGHMCV